MSRKMVTIDGNEAAAYVAYKTNEVAAIYPITPSSNMGEWADLWSSQDLKNIYGTRTVVSELQSEGGASGAVHGALQTGSLTTTFTASQGLLLMIPNMFKIAGELTSTVFHIAARTIATHALSIFGDHSDVMSTRSTGWAMLGSSSVQEVMDMALISQAATLEARVPFLHFFDGFRTSHEVQKVEQLTDEDMRAMLPDELIIAHRKRALTPDNPVLRGTAQNPDVFFQSREAANAFYEKVPAIVQNAMDRFAEITGRQYHLFDYFGAEDAERVIMIMGSGAETVRETVEHLTAAGEKVGVLQVHLYRPFAADVFLNALPKTLKKLAVLDRTKESNALGEPMYQDVLTALAEAESLPFARPAVVGGRYGLSSKEFTPAMVKAVFDELAKSKAKNHFTVGIKDDVHHSSLDYDATFSTEGKNVFRGMFWGLGADGTVGANKNSIKIIGEETDNFAQGYFVYDSKKSGSITTSHLRFGPRPIRSTYLVTSANFVACHQAEFIHSYDMLKYAAEGSTFLLNTKYDQDEVWNHLPKSVQADILNKKIRFYVIDAYTVAKRTGMGSRINTIMQTCFFAISGILEREEAIAKIKGTIKKTYGNKGEEVVRKNYEAVDMTLANLHQVNVPDSVSSTIETAQMVSDKAPDFVKNVTAEIMAGRGDDLPVSAFPVDGTYPTGTTKWEKRNITLEVPEWDPEICIQCGKCAVVCPHQVIRMNVADEASLSAAPAGFKSAAARGKEYSGTDRYILQLAVEDCTGCEICIDACPVMSKTEEGKRAINMVEQLPIREQERANLDFFLDLPAYDRSKANQGTIKGVQYLEPLFEFSGACAGCGETPYVGLISKLYGDRAVIANATGCSSIYGGNLPTTPWTTNAQGRGPAWSNSLFEDNAEFGLGFRLSIDKQTEYARELVVRLRDSIGAELADALLSVDQSSEEGISTQRENVDKLKKVLADVNDSDARFLESVADNLVKRSVWIMGGDGWAYDIGYGGLDHVLASGANVNILVMDTEVYSNTGGQMSKATPRAAVAKFAAGGKPAGKKDLGLMAMSYGNVYIAQIAMGANDMHTLKAIREAEAYNGPSLIIAYSHCIAHGINMAEGNQQQKAAVNSGYWPLYRYNPDLADEGRNPFQLDSKDPKIEFRQFAYNETRYKMLKKIDPSAAETLMVKANDDVQKKWHKYTEMAK